MLRAATSAYDEVWDSHSSECEHCAGLDSPVHGSLVGSTDDGEDAE